MHFKVAIDFLPGFILILHWSITKLLIAFFLFLFCFVLAIF